MAEDRVELKVGPEEDDFELDYEEEHVESSLDDSIDIDALLDDPNVGEEDLEKLVQERKLAVQQKEEQLMELEEENSKK